MLFKSLYHNKTCPLRPSSVQTELFSFPRKINLLSYPLVFFSYHSATRCVYRPIQQNTKNSSIKENNKKVMKCSRKKTFRFESSNDFGLTSSFIFIYYAAWPVNCFVGVKTLSNFKQKGKLFLFIFTDISLKTFIL